MTPVIRTAVPALTPAPDGGPALAALTGGAAPAHHGPERLQVDPATLVVDENIRKDTRLTAEFLASLNEHGLLVPIQVRRDPLGQLLVVDGQRRTLGALQVGLLLVDVVVLDGIGDDEARVTAQYVINEQRASLSAKERADTIQQLSLFGRSPAAIKRKLGMPQADVDAALALAAAPSVATALVEHEVEDLVAGATIVEFADDPEIVTELARLVKRSPGRLAHRASEIRQDRARQAVAAEARAELEGRGITVIDQAPYFIDGAEALYDLTNKPDAAARPAIKAAEHEKCPGHAIYVTTGPKWHRGDLVGHEVRLVEACVDWRKHGHHKRSGTAKTTTPATPGEAEAAKAARRKLIADNKAAEAAQPVRNAWISEFLQRKTMPTDAPIYVARALAILSHGSLEHGTARALLWPTKAESLRYKEREVADLLTTSAVGTRYLVALAAASIEAVMPKDFHRKGGLQDLYVTHLTTLRSWGYELADVEAAFLEAQTAKAAA